MVLAMLVLTLRRGLLVVTVQQTSMCPALKPGDRVLVVRHWPGSWLRKGQVVLVWPSHVMSPDPVNPASGTPYIKRIVGMPGDSLVTSLEEMHPQLRPPLVASHDREGRRTWHVPPGHVFVLGDHVPRGFDSLTWGPVPFNCVRGVMLMKLADAQEPPGTNAAL
ncbi:MAG TPA: signal peptidase I [Chloroflexia bacterium]|jgi:signal peptidase I